MRSFTEFILSEAEGFRMTGQKLSDPSTTYQISRVCRIAWEIYDGLFVQRV